MSAEISTFAAGPLSLRLMLMWCVAGLLARFTLGFAGPAPAIAAVSRGIQGSHGRMVPASNARCPVDLLPGWMHVLVLRNLAGCVIDRLRELAVGRSAEPPLWPMCG